MPENIIRIQSQPGIKRDGTMLEGDAYVDGQWVRFQRGLPRKIGGYRSINKYLSEISRALHAYTQNDLTYVHSGSANKIERFTVDTTNNTSAITDRTPASGFTANTANVWQFDVDSDSTQNLLIAQVAPNGVNIANSSGGQLFSGPLLGTSALTAITLPTGGNCTGGVVSLHPYTFIYGTDGYVAWSVAGDPTDFNGTGSGSANVASQKIVKGVPLRGGPGNSPSGLFWSLDALVRGTFVGGAEVFQFDTISTESSILSPNGAIEYDGVFYWVGVDRFLMFNGVVREVPNAMNINWFFDGLNVNYAQKVFAFKVPRYGEIWWCYPRGEATECSHAVIYNVRENTWYDCELPNGGRSAGTSPSVFRKPLLTGVQSSPSGYKLWIHETGVDEVDGISTLPVYSFFETAEISLPVSGQVNKQLEVLCIEPDFVQSGEMTLSVHGRFNTRSPEVEGPFMPFPAVATTKTDQVVYLKTQRRQMRFRFASNVVGGDYQMGLILGHFQPGDGTMIG
jgi:hypothetical protein